jgi:hypothetical protein
MNAVVQPLELYQIIRAKQEVCALLTRLRGFVAQIGLSLDFPLPGRI